MTYEADCRIHPNNTVTKDTEKIPQKNKKMRNFICGNLLKKAPQKRCVFAALFSNFTNNSANNFINYLNFYLIFFNATFKRLAYASEFYGKGRTFALFALYRNAPTFALANLFYHSKPQAEAAVFAAVRLVYREKSAEHLA